MIQKTIIKICPNGLPFAQKRSAPTPINDEINDKMLFSGAKANDMAITTIDEINKVHSNFEKYVTVFFILSPEKSIRRHIFKDLTMCLRMLLHHYPVAVFIIIYYIKRDMKCQALKCPFAFMEDRNLAAVLACSDN